MVEDGTFILKIVFVIIVSKSERASKLHYWYKSYGDFSERVDFSNWWSFSDGVEGPRSTGLPRLTISY